MNPPSTDAIRDFLLRVRKRAQIVYALKTAGMALAVWLALWAAFALSADSSGPAGFWPPLSRGLALAGLISAIWIAIVAPARRLRLEDQAARFVGTHVPALASDLLSAVELRDTPTTESPSLVDAFLASTAERLAECDPAALLPWRLAGPRLFAGVTALGMFALGTLVSPNHFRHGLALLFHQPTWYEGASVSAEPLVGDIKIVYEYPPYTGLPVRTIEGSSGDVIAVKGTRATLTMRPLRSAHAAALLLGDSGDKGRIDATFDKGLLRASWVLSTNDVYRVWLSPRLARPVREDRPHRIEAETDQTPTVEISGPAEHLTLPVPRPVEVAFSAHDDFGLDSVDLVYRVDEAPETRVPLREGLHTRSAQGKTVWSPDTRLLPPGARIAYHIEARDRDAVSGAKRGSSRTLYLTIENPRESFEDQLTKEREVMERLLGTLADRLELPASAQAEAWQTLHEAEEAHVAALGRLIDEVRQSRDASKAILTTLVDVANQLGRALRDEAELLGPLPLQGRASKGTAWARLKRHGQRHVATLESGVLALDDLIGRQRLDDLATLGQELTDSYKRLEDLLARYNATKDEALRRELARDVRDLRARIADLMRKAAELQARNDVPSEWQNLPDMREAADKARKFDALLDKGDPQSLAAALSELGQALSSMKGMLQKNADGFAQERFPQESREMAEMLKKVSDLESDERNLARSTAGLSAEVQEQMKRQSDAELDKKVRELNKKVDDLARRTAAAPPRALHESAQDELAKAREGVARLRRLFDDRDWGEARTEADQASTELDKIERIAKRQAARSGQSAAAPLEDFGAEMGQAMGLSRDISQALAELAPNEGAMASGPQKQRAKTMGEQQGELQRRAQQLAEAARKGAHDAPELDPAALSLDKAAQSMAEAEQKLGSGGWRAATGNQRDAVERLAQLRDSMQKRNGGGGSNKEPVRIPGADESQAPREWRQELMEAMREKAPEKFRDEVMRYYEELVK